jgi:hypothetical protein
VIVEDLDQCVWRKQKMPFGRDGKEEKNTIPETHRKRSQK